MDNAKYNFKAWYRAARTLITHAPDERHLYTWNEGGRTITMSRGYALMEYNGLRVDYAVYETRSAYWARWHELRNEDSGRYNAKGYRRATLVAMRNARICNPIAMLPR